MTSHDVESPQYATLPEMPTVDQLKAYLNVLAQAIRSHFGERASVIMMVGFPIPDGHDRFASTVRGPCLASRGLLSWGQRSVMEQIDEGDTSFNGKDHP